MNQGRSARNTGEVIAITLSQVTELGPTLYLVIDDGAIGPANVRLWPLAHDARAEARQ